MDNPKPDLTPYRSRGDDGPWDPLPSALDTAEGWQGRARLVRPDAAPAGQVAADGGWRPVFAVTDTVPIESDADLDATSAAPRASRVPGVYDYSPNG